MTSNFAPPLPVRAGAVPAPRRRRTGRWLAGAGCLPAASASAPATAQNGTVLQRPRGWWLTASIALGSMLASVVTAVVLLAGETPGSLQGATRVSATRARTLAGAGAALIDTRALDEYVREHIPGATSVPYQERSGNYFAFDPGKDSFDLGRLPADKKTPLVFYCGAGECWSSYKAARVAVESGYARVNWLRGGLPEWRAQGYAVATTRPLETRDGTRLAPH